jgi:hypothetical protein
VRATAARTSELIRIDAAWFAVEPLRAGQRAAAIMSLIQSAKLNGHDPYRYLKDILERLPTQPASQSSRGTAAASMVRRYRVSQPMTTYSKKVVPSCPTRSTRGLESLIEDFIQQGVTFIAVIGEDCTRIEDPTKSWSAKVRAIALS